jgi:hypothetical protein
MEVIDANSIEPLLTAAHDAPEPKLRVSTLNVAAHFPLSRDGWQKRKRGQVYF